MIEYLLFFDFFSYFFTVFKSRIKIYYEIIFLGNLIYESFIQFFKKEIYHRN